MKKAMKALACAALLGMGSVEVAHAEGFDEPVHLLDLDFGLAAGVRTREAYPSTDNDQLSGSVYWDAGSHGLYLDLGFDARPIPDCSYDACNGYYGNDPVFVAEMSEIRGGVLLAPAFRLDDGGSVEPYVGYGRDFFKIRMYTNFDNEASSDEAWGRYIRTGIRLRAHNAEFGVDLRRLTDAGVNLFGRRGTADYDQISVFMGLNWGQ